MSIFEHCARCPYANDGPAVGTRGEAGRRIVLVGEAPGAREVLEGLPFVGEAGAVLWEAVAKAGMDPEDIFVVNAVACRPSNPSPSKIRTPTSEAIRACSGRLADLLASHPREVIVALGATAIEAVTGRRTYRVTKKPREEQLTSAWGTVVPTVHPAFVLRRGGQRGGAFASLVADLRHARDLVARAGSSLPKSLDTSTDAKLRT